MRSEAAFDGRYRVLDSYRFIAAALICLYHFNKADVLGLGAISPFFSKLLLMVDFFFVLSGFVIARTYLDKIDSARSYGQFMWKRFARLYPLHLLTLVVGIAGGLIIGTDKLQPGTNPEIFSSTAIIANLTLTHSLGVTNYGSFNIPSWSISAEMFVYALFPLFALMITRRHPLVNVLLIALYVGALILARDALGMRPWTIAWYDGGALRAVPTFFAGALMASLLAGRWKNFAPPLVLAHLAVVATAIVMHLNGYAELVLIGFALIVLLTAAAEQHGATSRLQSPACVHLGDASYSLYMWHMPLKVGVFAVIAKLFGTGLAPMWGAALLSFCLSLGIALLCYRYFEMPARRYLTGLWPTPSRLSSKRMELALR